MDYLRRLVKDDQAYMSIKSLEFAQTSPENVELTAPNNRIRLIIESQCLREIKYALDSVLNRHINLNLTTRDPSNIPKNKGARSTAIFESNLNPKQTFDNFVEGKSNAIAKSVSYRVSQKPGNAYNPLYIYSDVGLGKTHLLHSIGNEIHKIYPSLRIMYLNAQRFVSDMVIAHKTNDFERFSHYYRSLNVILIDDVQFFAGKERSQEEFFHTFNTLFDSGHQIVMTSDSYPTDIEGLHTRLKSRFVSGVAQSIEMPDLETRAAIILNKSMEMDLNFDEKSAIYLAKRICSNVRELEGALNSISADILHYERENEGITIEFIEETLSDLISSCNRKVSVDNIIVEVCKYFNLKYQELMTKSRKQHIARPRQIAMALAKDLTNKSLPEIAESFGKRNHTTVLHACKRISKLKKIDSEVKETYSKLLRQLSKRQ